MMTNLKASLVKAELEYGEMLYIERELGNSHLTMFLPSRPDKTTLLFAAKVAARINACNRLIAKYRLRGNYERAEMRREMVETLESQFLDRLHLYVAP